MSSLSLQQQNTSASSWTLPCALSTTPRPACSVSVDLPPALIQHRLTGRLSFADGTPEHRGEPRVLCAVRRGRLFQAQVTVRHSIGTRVVVVAGIAADLARPSSHTRAGDDRQAPGYQKNKTRYHTYRLLQPGCCHRWRLVVVDSVRCGRSVFVLWIRAH